MKNLFAYGTLMCEDIMEDVSGTRVSRISAILEGYRRRSVKNEPYPGMVPCDTGRVDGVVYRDVPGPAWHRLDRFEGDMYARRTVAVELTDGTALPAETYVVRPEFEHLLDSTDWDFERFLLGGKTEFQRYYDGYRSL